MRPTGESIEETLAAGVEYCSRDEFWEIATLALEADTLRTALEELMAATRHAFHAPAAAAGDVQAMIAAYENARTALGGTER